MIWRTVLAAGLALFAFGIAAAQEAPASYDPVVTQHTLVLPGQKIAYTATAGLMPLHGIRGQAVGDMSYIAYAAPAPRGGQRPIAFLWNGGPGANSIPIQYGAFGPKRLAQDEVKPNAATLLDVADLVFIDQIETGYGRVAEGIDRTALLNTGADARAFAQFIESFLTRPGWSGRPIFLIGESYGVLRAVNVSAELLKRGITTSGIVLISGFPTVGMQLPDDIDGALRIPGYAALAFTYGLSDPSAGSTSMEVHDRALALVAPVVTRLEAGESIVDAPDLEAGLPALFGAEAAQRFHDWAAAKGINNVLNPHSYVPSLVKRVGATSGYDTRSASSGAEWISRAVINDIRHDLAFDLSRLYLGYEAKPVEAGPSTPAPPPDGSHADLAALMKSLGVTSITRAKPARTDGMADMIVSATATFGVKWPPQTSPMPALLAANPKLGVFVAGGIFDDLFPCAVGDEMARRVTSGFEDRVTSRCYAGGHMMYGEAPVGALLSDDIRAFIRKVG